MQPTTFVVFLKLLQELSLASAGDATTSTTDTVPGEALKASALAIRLDYLGWEKNSTLKTMTQKEGVANIPHKKVQTVSTKPDIIFVFLVSAYNTAFTVCGWYRFLPVKYPWKYLRPCHLVTRFDQLDSREVALEPFCHPSLETPKLMSIRHQRSVHGFGKRIERWKKMAGWPAMFVVFLLHFLLAGKWCKLVKFWPQKKNHVNHDLKTMSIWCV